MAETKKEREQKKTLARIYYMQGESQKSIAGKTGVSEQTICRWVAAEHWDVKRAGEKVARPELINGILKKIANLLESSEEKDLDFDKLSKAAAAIERLDKKANVVDMMQTFTEYDSWLQKRFNYDKELSAEFIKMANKYEDLFVSEMMSK
ncbi:hypothetical protein FACS1894162_3600 [Bacteroidia bacterium]|nr:hypothetical protein FACS1894162_3600 [Bacteroidia bacterium]